MALELLNCVIFFLGNNFLYFLQKILIERVDLENYSTWNSIIISLSETRKHSCLTEFG